MGLGQYGEISVGKGRTELLRASGAVVLHTSGTFKRTLTCPTRTEGDFRCGKLEEL